MNRLRVGLLGVRAGQPYLEACRRRDDLVVACLCDRETDPLAAAAQTHAIELAVTSDERLWGAKLDAVIIAGSERLHRKHILSALEAGLHVLCLPPLASFRSDAAKLVGEAARYGQQRVMLGQSLRFHPLFAAVGELVAGGRLGEVYAVRLTHYAPAEAYLADDPARADAQGGTPPLLAVGHHALDLALWLGGRPVLATADAAQRLLLRQPFDDTVSARFVTDERALLEVFLALGARRPPAVAIELLGTRGSVSAATDRTDNRWFQHDQGKLIAHELPPGPGADGVAEALDEFVAAIREGREPRVGLADGARSVACALAALEAAKAGAAVPLTAVGG